MLTASIAIIGGGLSGLYAASLLEQEGIKDYVLLEARESLGGRVRSVSSVLRGTERVCNAPVGDFDLGATWYWPGLQPELGCLIEELELAAVALEEEGSALVEQWPKSAPTRVSGSSTLPVSMRLVGGMAALVDGIRSRVTGDGVRVGQRVSRIRYDEGHIEVVSEDVSGRVSRHRVETVLLALPPRIAVTNIEFTPALPVSVARAWRSTGTWMASHAKYLAIFEKPFWRKKGLSGLAHSIIGPLSEIQDVSAPGGDAALSGYISVPAATRRLIPESLLRSRCRIQLTRLFGPEAGKPTHEFLKDWALDPFSATEADRGMGTFQASAPTPIVPSGVWKDRILGVASEWSPHFPGYVAGAIDAARHGVAAILSLPGV